MAFIEVPEGKTLDEIHAAQKKTKEYSNITGSFVTGQAVADDNKDLNLGSDDEVKNVVEGGRQKKIIKYYDKQPVSKEPIESLMIVPYVSVKTFPDYIRMMIESYEWMPQMVHYVANDVNKPLYQNKFDWKCIETFRAVNPTKYFVHHASDNYVMPNDLGRWKYILDNDEKAFACGIYPIGVQMRHSQLFEDFVCPSRVVMWKADIFKKFMEPGIEMSSKIFGGVPLDAVYFMAYLAQKAGYHSVIDGKARPFTVLKEEFKTMWINPDNQD